MLYSTETIFLFLRILSLVVALGFATTGKVDADIKDKLERTPLSWVLIKGAGKIEGDSRDKNSEHWAPASLGLG